VGPLKGDEIIKADPSQMGIVSLQKRPESHNVRIELEGKIIYKLGSRSSLDTGSASTLPP
jgi:hypothetical protein